MPCRVRGSLVIIDCFRGGLGRTERGGSTRDFGGIVGIESWKPIFVLDYIGFSCFLSPGTPS